MEILRYTPFLSNNTFKDYRQIERSSKKIHKEEIEERVLSFLSKPDAANDGKFSVGEASKNFIKGVITPVTFMFKSPKNFLVGAGMIAASVAAMVATGGALAPVLLTVGAGMSAIQIGVGINKILKAKNGDDTEKAFVDIGAGSSGIGLSLLSAKTSLKQSHMVINDLDPFQANLAVKNVNPVKALIQNMKMIPEALIETKNTIKNGSALVRLVDWVTFKKPNVAIVDGFTNKQVDIDGDLRPDISHGRLVESIVKGNHKNTRTINVEATVLTDRGRTFTPKKMTEGIQSIIQRIEKGEKIDAVNMSLGGAIPIERFGKNVGKALTRGNVLENKAAIRALIKKESPDVNALLESLESLTKKGVKVYISGGNDGPANMNLLNLADGVINVGSTNATGAKMFYSADSKLINKFAQGTKNVTPVVKKNILQGYDITGNGKVDVPVSETSGGLPFVSKYVGKKAKNLVLNNDEFNELLNSAKALIKLEKQPSGPGHIPPKHTLSELQNIMNKYAGRLLTTKKYAEFATEVGSQMSSDTLLSLRAQNQLVTIGTQKPTYFDVNKKGLLTFNPDGSGRNAVSVIHGTSFSAPRALGLDLNKNFANLNTFSRYTKSSLGPTLNTSDPFRLLNNKSKNS